MKMMLCTFLVLTGLFAKSQTLLDTLYTKDVCGCMNDYKSAKNKITKEAFVSCFQTALYKHTDLIMKECMKQFGDTSYESGYKHGQALSERAMISMVKDCDDYYHTIDSMRYDDYKNVNNDSLREALTMLGKNPVQKDIEFFKRRSNILFQLKMYDEALKDLEAILVKDDSDIRSNLLKGWIYEMQGDYDKAITFYNKTANLSKVRAMYIFAEIAKRKKAEQAVKG